MFRLSAQLLAVCRKWQLFITRRVGASNAAQRCYRLHNCGRCQNVSGAVTSLSPDSYHPLHPPSQSPSMCSAPVAREIDIFCYNQYRGFLDHFIISIFLQAVHSWHSSRCVNY